MICHYPDLSSASDRLKKISHAAQLIRSTTQIISIVIQPRSQVLSHGISELVPQTSFRWWWRREMSAIFSVYHKPELLFSYFFVGTNPCGCQLNTVFTAKKLVWLTLGRTRSIRGEGWMEPLPGVFDMLQYFETILPLVESLWSS